MENKKNTYQHYYVEDLYNAAQEKMEELEKIEAERFLNRWEKAEKERAQMDIKRYGRILEEEEEENRQQICESQGLSRWC